jgi:hypothetical protein
MGADKSKGEVDIHGRLYSPRPGLDYYITESGDVYKKCNPRGFNTGGYKQYAFGRGCVRYIHDLVCRLWNGEPEEGQLVRHLDGNPTNNHASNLAWGTQRDNMIDMALHGRQGQQKLSADDVKAIKAYPKEYGSRKELAAKYNITENYVTELRRGDKQWLHL